MRLLPLLGALLCVAAGVSQPLPALAQSSFSLPGLERDSNSYASELGRRFPAGANAQLRARAEQTARDAERRNDWAAAAAAWEQRLGMPEPTAAMWLSLAQAQLSRNPPEAARALQAAWQNFMMVPAGTDEIPSLQVIAQALQRLDRQAQAIVALQAVTERAPDDSKARDALAQARRAAGLLVSNTRPEPEADPARACISFAGSLTAAADFRPGDWVRADPPIPDLAVERENGQLCVAGLPWGRSTRIVLRAGLPGQDGVNLRADTPVNIAMPDRAAKVLFDGTRFLLPRGQASRVGIATVNLRSLKLTLVRVTERNLVPFGRDNALGNGLESYLAGDVADRWGRTVWQGRAEVPNFRPNVTTRTVLPLPDAMAAAGPGLYVLVAQNGEDKESDGSSYETTAGLQILATDLGLTAWRGPDGLAAQVRSFGEGTPREGIRVALMSRSNDILAESRTGPDGLVRFGAPLLRGQGPMAPVNLTAETGDDLVTMNLEAASFDLSDRGAEGRVSPGPLDAFLYTDRGIYRPGETVNLTALLRDGAGRPQDLPLRLKLLRPNGQVAAEAVPPRGPDGAVLWSVPLSSGASVGQWTLEARTEPDQPAVGSVSFTVDAFVPERLAMTFGPAPGPLVPGTPLPIPLTARFLYGSPGSNLEGEFNGVISVDPDPFSAPPPGAPGGVQGTPEGTRRQSPWRGWRFGLAEEPLTGGLSADGTVATDEAGNATVSVNLPAVPDATRPLRAELTVTLNDPNGRPSRASLTVPIRGTAPYVAIKPAFEGGSVDANTEAGFDLAIVSPDGAALPGRLRVRLVRERPEWRIVTRNGTARYETTWRDEPVDSAEVSTAPGAPARFARALPFGRYRIEAAQPGGLGIAAMRFRSGWVGTDSPEVPDKVDVSADRPAYNPGDTARLHISSPFAGRASVAVLTQGLVSLREVEVPEGGTDVSVPVDPSWGPGAYVTVTVFRPGRAAEGQPRRALGLAWVALDKASRSLGVAIDTPDLLRPRQRVEVPVRVSGASGSGGTGVAGPVHLTLAAVDEGILRITRFSSPDPVEHFMGRRRLGTDIRDDYGRLIPPPEGDVAALRQGGDADLTAGAQPPQRIVSLFSGIVEAGPDGVARVPLDLPDFAGELRLMAVAWSGDRTGAASKPVTVRDPVVAEALLPRFLAPGDEVRLPVLLGNVELLAGEVVAELRVEGPLVLDGPNRLTATLATGARATPFTTLRATGAGEGVVRLAVTAPGGFRAERESRISVHSSRPQLTEVAVGDLAPGAQANIAPDLGRFVAGTASVRAVWGQPVRYDPDALLRAALDFPLWCAEQSATKVLALAVSPWAFPDAGQRDVQLGQAISRLLDRQRYDGAFSLWSASGEAEPWVTAYGTEALLRAKAVGATVPEAALVAALRSLASDAEDVTPSKPEERADQAYRLHVLALGNQPLPGATRRLFAQLDELPTPVSKAQLGAALARIGDTPRAEAAFNAALASAQRRPWYHDYGSAVRDGLAVTLLLKESGVLPDRLSAQLARLPGPAEISPQTTSTQEQAWAIALAATLGRDARPTRVALNGVNQPERPIISAPLNGATTVRNNGDRAVVQSVTVTGLPAQALPAARSGMRVSRRFLTMQGADLNLDQLRQNTTFILLVEARAEDGEPHRTLVQQGLPAGWEVSSRLPSGDVPGMAFLGTLSEPATTAALDDRFALAADLTAAAPVGRYAVVLRAVTPGRFELPGAEVRDMYRPTLFARQNAGRVAVLPPE
ncbi:alpha-2-macroglobulin [Roseomonas sp. BN140053]